MERRVRTSKEHRRSEKPADSRTAGWYGTHLRSTPTAGRFRLPRGDTEFFSGRPHPVHRTANELKVANRELGTIESIEEDRRLRLKMDGGRAVELDPCKPLHLDHGYAMTSHSSQGQTADRVLIHVDTDLGARDLLNSRMAYVSVSCGRYDAQIYTNNVATLGQELSRDVSHSPAIQQESVAQEIEPQTTPTNEIVQGFGLGL